MPISNYQFGLVKKHISTHSGIFFVPQFTQYLFICMVTVTWAIQKSLLKLLKNLNDTIVTWVWHFKRDIVTSKEEQKGERTRNNVISEKLNELKKFNPEIRLKFEHYYLQCTKHHTGNWKFNNVHTIVTALTEHRTYWGQKWL